jgi:hypothetical protein
MAATKTSTKRTKVTTPTPLITDTLTTATLTSRQLAALKAWQTIRDRQATMSASELAAVAARRTAAAKKVWALMNDRHARFAAQ